MKFPKTLYVKMETDKDTSYPVPGFDLTDIVEVGETIQVGVYELRETVSAKGEVNISSKVSKR